MVHDVFQILRVDRIKNIKEIFTVRAFFLCKVILKEADELLVILQIWPQIFY